MHKVNVHYNGELLEFSASDNQNLLELLRSNGISIDSPCNGNGTCGKCKVKIFSENKLTASNNEEILIGSRAVSEGYRLSCIYAVRSDIEVFIESDDSFVKIVTAAKKRTISLQSIVSKKNILLDKPDISDNKADYERVLNTAVLKGSFNPDVILGIPKTIRENDYNVTVVATGEYLLAVEAGDTSGAFYGIAVDIGTTTIAAYLVNLSTGERICVNSLLNPQKKFGADVISRIKHTMDCETGLEELNALLLDAINTCISVMCMQAHIEPANIYAVTLAGNTAMLHFLLKACAVNIASAPFVPAFTSMLELQARQLGISINPSGVACILPSVSAYIGADTVAAVLSTGMSEQADISLLIDIGTNGEIVLGNKDMLYACSSAAGPAFEGANIRNGMGSISGAISSVTLKQGIKFSTIADTMPMGICGTGIVDLLAELLALEIVDETGRIDSGWEPDRAAQAVLAQRICKVDGIVAFVLCSAAETKNGREIAVTQKDIRELQNAKAAIAAGINVLLIQAGIGYGDIKNVYLAGGFGSCINIESALKIGLIPAELQGKILSAGNAAGQGAVEALINSSCLASAEKISKKIKYIELSGNKDFNKYYIDCMMF
jgi:uncharacterized 2Fe-2S/4Fe-4S cluster protein (DUF4445 family)